MGVRFVAGLLVGAIAVSLVCTGTKGNEAITEVGKSIKEKTKECLEELKEQTSGENKDGQNDGND